MDFIHNFEPHLLLLDLNMPKMDGFQVLAQLQEKKASVETIVVSANIQAAAMRRAKELGAVGFLAKPLSEKTLTAISAMVASQKEQFPKETERAIETPIIPNYGTNDLDALGELLNVGLGHSVAALADLLECEIEISVPQTYLLGDRLDSWLERFSQSTACFKEKYSPFFEQTI